ncbi:unnamed protein product [Phytomonas sp. EM1]|nr:unnamed protein product [Phytomonas sp. EM1]|eukprot:CCW63532.1 unnamed protein product [Phytomonas sp. isolate EM1]
MSSSSHKPPNPFKQGDKVNLPSFRDCYASFVCSLKNLGEQTIMAPSPAYKLNRASERKAGDDDDNDGSARKGEEGKEELTLISLNSTCSHEDASPEFVEEAKGREEEGGASPTTFNDDAFTPTRPSPPLFHPPPHPYHREKDNHDYRDLLYHPDYHHPHYPSATVFHVNGVTKTNLGRGLPAMASIEQRVSAILPPVEDFEGSGAFAYYRPKLPLQERISSSSSPLFMAALQQRPSRLWKSTSFGNGYSKFY